MSRPLSSSLQRLMKGWGVPKEKEINSVPINNSLAAIVASRLTPQQVVNFLSVNRVVSSPISRAVEARLDDLTKRGVHRNEMSRFAGLYKERKRAHKRARNSKSRSIARSVGRKWAMRSKKKN